MATQPHLLVVEDDRQLNSSIAKFVASFSDVDQAFSGDEGLYLAEQGIYDAIILDIMLPEIDGYHLLQQLRAQQITTPVLVLTAKAELTDKLHGFEVGADDYLTKPFHREELVMRLKALLKRSGHFFDDNELVVGQIHLNLTLHTVTAGDEEVVLSGREFDLLAYLMQNQAMIITKEQIFDRLWGFDSDTALTVVEVYMSNLRRKLKPSGADQQIQTIRNVGYILKAGESS